MEDLPRGAGEVNGPSRLLFASPLVRIGSFRAATDHPRFRDSGPIPEHTFVFPRTAVTLQYEGARAFHANANMVTFYNAGQVYQRRALDPAGDHCEWFEVRADLLSSLVGDLDPAAGERPDRPFTFRFGPAEARTYLLQREIVRGVAAGSDAVDTMAVEEAVAHLTHLVLRRALDSRLRAEALAIAPRELVERVKEMLGRGFHLQLSLADLATRLRCSPYYLARTFRRVTGTSIHRYLVQLRLARSLERVAVGERLEVVGLEVGFASHSHFTAAFRRAFAMTPSQFRRSASPIRVRRGIC